MKDNSRPLQHLISSKQLNRELIKKIFGKAEYFENSNSVNKKPLVGKVVACIFYEPSTRTRLSFESAALRLGAAVISTESASHFSSAVKGETIEDTIRIISGYADAIVLRHYKEGAAEVASRFSTVTVINAGDGSGEHPTQALLDLYTIKKELGRIDGIKIGLVGDLLYGRTVHSLLRLLNLYKNIKIYLVSPKELRIPEEIRTFLIEKKADFKEIEDLSTILNDIDVLYVTRIQKERFKSKKKYESLKASFQINNSVLRKLKNKAIIMHPLPRVTEISFEVDSDKRAAYFRQAKNGLFVRMAILDLMLGED